MLRTLQPDTVDSHSLALPLRFGFLSFALRTFLPFLSLLGFTIDLSIRLLLVFIVLAILLLAVFLFLLLPILDLVLYQVMKSGYRTYQAA